VGVLAIDAINKDILLVNVLNPIHAPHKEVILRANRLEMKMKITPKNERRRRRTKTNFFQNE